MGVGRIQALLDSGGEMGKGQEEAKSLGWGLKKEFSIHSVWPGLL